MTGVLPDLIYPVRPGENEELRYSLRSVEKYAAGTYRKIWVMGHALPAWLWNVEVLDVGNPASAWQDVAAKVEAVVNHPGVSDEVVLFNDDLFVVEAITEWEPLHMGPTSRYVEFLGRQPDPTAVDNSNWLRIVVATADWMRGQGYGDILARQGHVPMPFDTAKLAAVLAQYPSGRPLDVVGLYDAASVACVGREAGNTKVDGWTLFDFMAKYKHGGPYLSTHEFSFGNGAVGEWLRGQFPDPSRYEQPAEASI